MELVIEKYDNFERPWLVKRVCGEYKMHAHMKTKKDAEKVVEHIKRNKYPIEKEIKTAVQRILTEEEFKSLDKKQRYYNINNGAPSKRVFYRK